MDMDIKILGFKAVIESVDDILAEINSLKSNDEVIQLLNADAIAGPNHIIHGVNQAFLAFERGVNFASDLSVEICLRCSAQKQISKAFDLLGLKEGEMNLCVVLVNSSDEVVDKLFNIFTPDDNVLIPNYSVLKEIYNISDDELKNIQIEDIIIDKITKLSVDY